MNTTFTPVIHSLLETDLYKFTMLQAMLHQLPGNSAEYRFVCRNKTAFPLAEMVDEVNAQLDHLCTLRFQPDELEYLAGLRFIKPDFVQFLRLFQFHRSFIEAKADGDNLSIVAKGPQVHVMGFEIFVLAIVNELYFRRLGSFDLGIGRERLDEKISLLKRELENNTRRHPFEFFDFGLRRRFSGAWQDEVVATLKARVPEYFRGTSNVYLAKKHGVTPMGTQAHEWFQTWQASPNVQLKFFQRAALEAWVAEYRGDLGIALTDVVGMDAFLNDFDLFLAKLFDGLRQDSGDPYAWGEKALSHYAKLRIDANTKRFNWSDSLDMPTAVGLYRHFADRVQVGFGIGTNLTNDCGHKALNIVMKLVRCNGQPVAKLADTPGKTLCDDETFLAYLRSVFNRTAD
ncbi:nicotinate phosphoribosyltransferase [Paucibacter soli]|uniref:nicotinate phosphoribosyltransferase n=1 Tax=Paucibacter soli TaxID=3133433 RepID=UPI00309D9FA6